MHTTLRNHHLTARRSLAALSTAAALTLGLVTGPTPAAQAVPVDGSVTTTDTNTAPDTSGVTLSTAHPGTAWSLRATS